MYIDILQGYWYNYITKNQVLQEQMSLKETVEKGLFCSYMMKSVEIYTDGSCKQNPGPGGWGAVLVYNGKEKELCGGEAGTTNNRMELTAVIRALQALKEPCKVTLTSDSKYVVDAVTRGWASSWRAHGWRKADKSPALNADLWESLLDLLEIHLHLFHL